MSMAIPVLVIVAWGALAFGGVYDWAFQPLLILCPAIGLWGLLRPVPAVRRRAGAALLSGLLLLVAAISIQLIPLDRATLIGLSAPTDEFLRQYDLGYAFSVVAEAQGAPSLPTTHPLTINPDKTRLSLAFVAGFGVFLLGLQRGLNGRDLRILAPGLTAFGVLMALLAIVQKALWNGKVYGFWEPESAVFAAFGPFINRNHFAGWMLMAVPITAAYFAAHLSRSMAGIAPRRRSPVLWFSTPDASRAVLAGTGVLVMGLALTMTLSRSGIVCLFLALLLSGLSAMRRQRIAVSRKLYALFLVAVFAGAVSWTGVGAVAGRFADFSRGLGARGATWADAWRIHQAFPAFGSGLNTFGTATTLLPRFVVDKVHYAEAHNDYAQLLAEGGYLVTVPAAFLILIFAWQVRERFREDRDDHTGYWLRLGAVTGIVAITLQETVDFSLQMPGNAALFTVLCAMAVRKSSAGAASRRMPAPATGIAIVAVAALALAASACSLDTSRLPVVQTVYAKDTGRLTLLTCDTNQDREPDIWFHMDGTRILRIEIDTDFDRAIDRWEHYTPDGALERIGISRAGAPVSPDGATTAAAGAVATGRGLLASNRTIIQAVEGVPGVLAPPDAGGSR